MEKGAPGEAGRLEDGCKESKSSYVVSANKNTRDYLLNDV